MSYKYNDNIKTNNSTDFDSSFRATHPSDKITVPEHTFIVDSRQRDCKIFPSPAFYKVDLGTVYKNVTSIELKGSIIPRSSYNVHSTNKYIDFSIGSTITEIKVTDGGYGYTAVPSVVIGMPYNSGTQATATAIVTNGQISAILIGVSGSGYIASQPPVIEIGPPQSRGGKIASAIATVGTHYTAILREGQYTIGGNPSSSVSGPTGIIAEIQNAMNYAVNGGNYNPTSTSPFEVRLVNQYPDLNAILGEPAYYNTNACTFNRIQITNVNSDHWELLLCSGPNNKRNSSILMGFDWMDYYEPVLTSAVSTSGFTLISQGLTIRAPNDYDLFDDPKYVILSFTIGENSFERIESANQSLNRKFGTMIFDANSSNVLTDTTGTTMFNGTSSYLVGAVEKGTFWKEPGILKAIKGFDFDQKRLEFSPPIGKLSDITIKFTKFSTLSDGNPEFYNFCGKNHLLVFSVRSTDNQSGQKW